MWCAPDTACCLIVDNYPTLTIYHSLCQWSGIWCQLPLIDCAISTFARPITALLLKPMDWLAYTLYRDDAEVQGLLRRAWWALAFLRIISIALNFNELQLAATNHPVQFSLYSSPIRLVFARQVSSRNSDGFPLNGGVKQGWGRKNSQFSANNSPYYRNCVR